MEKFKASFLKLISTLGNLPESKANRNQIKSILWNITDEKSFERTLKFSNISINNITELIKYECPIELFTNNKKSLKQNSPQKIINSAKRLRQYFLIPEFSTCRACSKSQFCKRFEKESKGKPMLHDIIRILIGIYTMSNIPLKYENIYKSNLFWDSAYEISHQLLYYDQMRNKKYKNFIFNKNFNYSKTNFVSSNNTPNKDIEKFSLFNSKYDTHTVYKKNASNTKIFSINLKYNQAINKISKDLKNDFLIESKNFPFNFKPFNFNPSPMGGYSITPPFIKQTQYIQEPNLILHQPHILLSSATLQNIYISKIYQSHVLYLWKTLEKSSPSLAEVSSIQNKLYKS